MAYIIRLAVIVALGFWQFPLSASAAPGRANGESSLPEMQTPIMQQAKAAFRKGDMKTAANLIRQAAKSGNSIAKVILGKLYAEGRSVPKDYVQSLNLLAGVIKRQQQPSLGLATEALGEVVTVLKNSPNSDERQLALMAAMLPLAANPVVQQMSRNLQSHAGDEESLAGHVMRHNFIENGDPFEFGE